MSAIESSLPFDPTAFRSAWPELRRMCLEEWPAVKPEALDATEGDPNRVIDAIAAATDHTRARVRKHLGELSEVAGVGASGLEAKLVRLLHRLEAQAEPMVDGAARAREKAAAIAAHIEAAGRDAINDVKEVVPQAEEKMRENLWTSLLAALGVGLILGLIVGLSRSR